jgi:hypothetical protein
MENPPEGTEFREDGQTDSQDEGNSLFPQFCERASKWRELNLHASLHLMAGTGTNLLVIMMNVNKKKFDAAIFTR